MKKSLSAVLVLILLLTCVFSGTVFAKTSEQRTVTGEEQTKAGSLFAGWFEDAEMTTPIKNPEANTQAYAKFVDEAVLSVKYQITADANENMDNVNLRVVTTTDSLDFANVGFKLEYGTHTGDNAVVKSSTKVSKTLIGYNGTAALEYTPAEAVGSDDAEYFSAFNFTVPASMFNTPITVTAFWDTFDGTRVFGAPREITISGAENYNNLLIGNAAELTAFAAESQSKNFEGWKVKLTADIDLNQDWTASATAPATVWPMIGKDSLPFNGTFDGQGHTVSGVYVANSSDSTGFFSQIHPKAVVKDFRLKNSYLEKSSGNYLGAICGKAIGGTFEKIYSDAIVHAGACNQTGGLIGAVSGGGNSVTLSECWFAGDVTINGAASWLGGLIGVTSSATTLTNCVNTGTIYHKASVGTAGVGGLIGMVQSDNTLINCLNSKNPAYTAGTGKGMLIGMIEQKYVSTLVTDCCHVINANKNLVDNIRGTSNSVGNSGFTGSDTCTRQSASDVAGLTCLTSANAAKVRKLFTAASGTEKWSITSDSLPVLTYFADEYPTWTLAVDGAWYDGSASEFTLTDRADLYGFAMLSRSNAFTGKTVKLGADITINEGTASTFGTTAPTYNWLSIGDTGSYRFAGTFDGQMHTIDGLYLSASANHQGLFGGTDNSGIVENFYLKNSYVTSTNGFLGSIIGNARGTLRQVYSEAIVYGLSNYIGGLVGVTSETGTLLIEDCCFGGEVTMNAKASYLGGILGFALNPTEGAVVISNSMNTNSLGLANPIYHKATVQTAGVGGIVGGINDNCSVTIRDSINTQNAAYSSGATATTYGLIVGSLRSGATVTLENCHSINWYNKALVGGHNDSEYTTCSKPSTASIAGELSLTYSPVCNLFTNTTSAGHWVCSVGSLPVLDCFDGVYVGDYAKKNN